MRIPSAAKLRVYAVFVSGDKAEVRDDVNEEDSGEVAGEVAAPLHQSLRDGSGYQLPCGPLEFLGRG